MLGAGVVLEGPGDVLFEQALKFKFKTSNNKVEYQAIIASLNLALDLEVTKLICRSDSQLVDGFPMSSSWMFAEDGAEA